MSLGYGLLVWHDTIIELRLVDSILCTKIMNWKNNLHILNVCSLLCNFICLKREVVFTLMIISACLHFLNSWSHRYEITVSVAVCVTSSLPFGPFSHAIFWYCT